MILLVTLLVSIQASVVVFVDFPAQVVAFLHQFLYLFLEEENFVGGLLVDDYEALFKAVQQLVLTTGLHHQSNVLLARVHNHEVAGKQDYEQLAKQADFLDACQAQIVPVDKRSDRDDGGLTE